MLAFLGIALVIYSLLIERNAYIFFAALVLIFLSGEVEGKVILGGAGEKTWVDGLSLIDPKFNMREVIKQLILLEDHMFHDNKHCRDCITKHFMTIEAYLDEAQTMKTDDPSQTDVAFLRGEIKRLGPEFLAKYGENKKPEEKDYIETANRLRQLRKEYAQKYAVY